MNAHGAPTADAAMIVPVSPPGQSAVALLHLTGPGAAAVMDRLLETPLADTDRASHRWLVAADGSRLDDALVGMIPPEQSYTGFALYELGVHGGRAVVRSVLDAAGAAGATAGAPAALAAFARRGGAMDGFAAAALRRLARGVHSTEALAVLGSAWDGSLKTALRTLRGEPDPADVAAWVARSRRARLLFRPARVALVGAPNAGKSTLFNALVGTRRAAVSAEEGTTRDAVEADVVWGGVRLRLIDTAGDADDPVTIALLARTDLRLDVRAADPEARSARRPERTRVAPAVDGVARLAVWSKADLAPAASGDDDESVARVSARSGAGIDDLKARILERVGAGAREPGPALWSAAAIRRLARLAEPRTPESLAAAAWIDARLAAAPE